MCLFSIRQVQSDSDSSSAVELNSATEISTDSEFERDPVTPHYSEDNKKPTTRIQVKPIRLDEVHSSPLYLLVLIRFLCYCR